MIGAGLAGLAAAERLVEAGCEVTILEARDRIGGRVWTADAAEPVAIELGPEWIGDGDVHDLLAARGEELVQADGRFYRRSGDGWESSEGQPGVVQAMLDRAWKVTRGDRPLLDALDECCGDPKLAGDRRRFLAYVEGFNAADPAAVSVRWLREVEENEPAEASDRRARKGTGRIAAALDGLLAGRAELRLGTAARSIRWRRGVVEVTAGDGAVLRARAAVITVPLPLLDSLRLDPEVPGLRTAAAGLAMGPVTKLVVRFRDPFWREIGPLRDMLFLQMLEQPVSVWWTAVDPEVPVLTGWAGGPQSLRLPAEPAALLDVAVGSLAAGLGLAPWDVARRLEAHHFHDWNRDPWSRGGYTWILAGGADAHRVLARPVEGTLFLAGEATCGEGYNAPMEGAVQSGRRAARQVVDSLSP